MMDMSPCFRYTTNYCTNVPIYIQAFAFQQWCVSQSVSKNNAFSLLLSSPGKGYQLGISKATSIQFSVFNFMSLTSEGQFEGNYPNGTLQVDLSM